jgi:DGQHR domain-containing protein
MPRFTGYASSDQFVATRKKMGGRWVIHIDLSIAQLVLGVEAPPVGVPQEDNREVDESRCREFATYVDGTPRWGSASLLLWCPEGVVSFDPLTEINDLIPDGVQVGTLSIPRNSRLSIHILDGQHRIKGFHIWVESKNKDLAKAREHLMRAREVGEPAVIAQAESQVRAAEHALSRTQSEYIGIDLVEVNTAKEARQIFADIANHAKGMSKALTTGFDTTKMVNRVTQRIATEQPHAVLAGRIDWHRDRLSGGNENLLSAKALADIVRAVYVGVNGRVSKVQERAAEDTKVYAMAVRFFDALLAAFPQLKEKPALLRESSLLGSGTMLRALAGAWYELTSVTDDTGHAVEALMSDSEAQEFFAKLAPHMAAPVRAGNGWLTTGCFPAVPEDGSSGVMAPSSRSQDLRGLSDALKRWAVGVEPLPF